jgi:hypothetical protein
LADLRVRCVVVLAVCLTLPQARLCRATDARARLEYERSQGAEACPGALDIREAVAERVGFDPFDDNSSRVLRCRIQADAQGLHAEITTQAADGGVAGVRHLTSADRTCHDLAPALLFVLSLAARTPEETPDKSASAGADDPDAPHGAPTASRPSVAIAPTVARAAVEPVVAVKRPLAVQVSAAVFATEASLPGPSAGAAVAVGVGRDQLSVLLEVAGEVPRSLALAGGQATVWRATGALLPCRSHRLLLGCAMVGVGLLHGAGVAIPEARSATGPWIGVGGRLGARFPLASALSLEARADVVIPVLRTRLLVGQAAVWTTPAVSGALGVAITRTFR